MPLIKNIIEIETIGINEQQKSDEWHTWDMLALDMYVPFINGIMMMIAEMMIMSH